MGVSAFTPEMQKIGIVQVYATTSIFGLVEYHAEIVDMVQSDK